MSNNNMSLISLLKNDDNFQKRLAAKVGEVKQDKGKILSFAATYSQKYEKEIEEGDKLKRNLLTEGEKRGQDADQVLSAYGRFVPARSTPILNMLYFLLRESGDDEVFGNGRYATRDIQDTEFKGLWEEVVNDKNNIKELPDVGEYFYGNVTLEVMDKLKKLKALAQSANENEAFSAYRKALEICKTHELNYDKIPCYVEKR